MAVHVSSKGPSPRGRRPVQLADSLFGKPDEAGPGGMRRSPPWSLAGHYAMKDPRLQVPARSTCPAALRNLPLPCISSPSHSPM